MYQPVFQAVFCVIVILVVAFEWHITWSVSRKSQVPTDTGPVPSGSILEIFPNDLKKLRISWTILVSALKHPNRIYKNKRIHFSPTIRVFGTFVLFLVVTCDRKVGFEKYMRWLGKVASSQRRSLEKSQLFSHCLEFKGPFGKVASWRDSRKKRENVSLHSPHP